MEINKFKTSKAKKHTKTEIISINGQHLKVSPIGLWIFANSFRLAAVSLPPSTIKNDVVHYYLICHSIELFLKAYLSLQGLSMYELSSASIGHNLEVLLKSAQKMGLSNCLNLRDEHLLEIKKASIYYEAKVFEYPAIDEIIYGYPSLPSLERLLETSSILANGLEKPCRNHS